MPPAAPAHHGSRAWVGFFVLLGGLAAAAVVVPIFYNVRQQLRPEQLAAARRLWAERGPADYDLTYRVTSDREAAPENHVVLVRGGQVVFASCEGVIVYLSPALAAAAGLPAGALGGGEGVAVPAVFDRIAGFLREQEESAHRNFIVAVFDPADGCPRRFVRRVRGTSTREEWNLRVWPPGTVGGKKQQAPGGQ
jgi:hypothetical protein